MNEIEYQQKMEKIKTVVKDAYKRILDSSYAKSGQEGSFPRDNVFLILGLGMNLDEISEVLEDIKKPLKKKGAMKKADQIIALNLEGVCSKI